MRDVVIVAAGRTAIGSFNGTLAGVKASDLGATVLKSLLTKIATFEMDTAKKEPAVKGLEAVAVFTQALKAWTHLHEFDDFIVVPPGSTHRGQQSGDQPEKHSKNKHAQDDQA